MLFGITAGNIMQLQIDIFQGFHIHITGTRQDSRKGLRGGQKIKKRQEVAFPIWWKPGNKKKN